MTWMEDDEAAFLGPLVDDWEAVEPTVTVDLPRLDFAEPAFGSDPRNPTAFVRPRWEYAEVQELEFGPDSNPDRAGSLFLEVWIQPGSGSRAAEIRAHLLDVYAAADLPALRGRSPMPLMGGRIDGDQGRRWWVEGLQWPFEINP